MHFKVLQAIGGWSYWKSYQAFELQEMQKDENSTRGLAPHVIPKPEACLNVKRQDATNFDGKVLDNERYNALTTLQ